MCHARPRSYHFRAKPEFAAGLSHAVLAASQNCKRARYRATCTLAQGGTGACAISCEDHTTTHLAQTSPEWTCDACPLRCPAYAHIYGHSVSSATRCAHTTMIDTYSTHDLEEPNIGPTRALASTFLPFPLCCFRAFAPICDTLLLEARPVGVRQRRAGQIGTCKPTRRTHPSHRLRVWYAAVIISPGTSTVPSASCWSSKQGLVGAVRIDAAHPVELSSVDLLAEPDTTCVRGPRYTTSAHQVLGVLPRCHLQTLAQTRTGGCQRVWRLTCQCRCRATR